MTKFVEVVLDQNFSRPLDYSVDGNAFLRVGMRVLVPLKSKLKKGVISKIKDASSYQSVKPVHQILSSDSETNPTNLALANWMATYYAAPLQKVFKLFVPGHVRNKKEAKKKGFLSLNQSHEKTLKAIRDLRAKAPKQAEILELILKSQKGVFLSQFPNAKSMIDALIEKKFIKKKLIEIVDETLVEEEFFLSPPKKLNEEQQKALDAIEKSLDSNSYQTHLIHGVTGSGKTEVYMQAMQKALSMNKSALVLVPEISLTSQTIERFKSRFSEKIAVLHYRKSLKEKTKAWEEIQSGEAKLVIGARSALFAPIKNLGLIIVDEEHDSSYKQSEESPCYHARDTAVMKALIEKCTIILGSATPSIESRYNAEIGKYQLHILKSRATSAAMPSVQIVDMIHTFEKNKGFTHFSDPLLEKIKDRIEKGEQALLFLNKRGYYRMQICRVCRHTIKCPHCDLALTFHKLESHLECHLCQYKRNAPQNCPNCSEKDSLHFKGFGTEHVEKSLHAIFPEVRTLRMDKDTTGKKNSHEEIFKQFRAHKADVLIGTQMIAKGFHFPSVTLVGILNPDAALHIPDFRAPENVFQLLTQVAGRAGRAELKGEVIIQTCMPEHPILKMAQMQDYDSFYQSQIEERKAFIYPPFCRLIKLSFSDKEESKALKKAEKAYKTLSKTLQKSSELLPISASGYAKVKDLFRFQFLIKAFSLSEVLSALTFIEDAKIDVDPLSTFF